MNEPPDQLDPAESGALFAVSSAREVDPARARTKRALLEPPPLQRHGPARIIALCNQKGGVGKTTSTINLGAALAEVGRRVLLVDFDPQGALSVGLGVQPHQLDLTSYNLLMERSVTVDDVIMKTSVTGVDLLPSNIDLSAAEIQLVTEVAREQTLARELRPVLDTYDYVLIDCQPSLGLLTINALTAAHGVIVPLECEFFSLRGVALLIDTIEKVQQRLNPDLVLDGILATMYDARTLHGREVFARVLEAFGDKVFDTVVARTVRFPETTVAGEPITSWASSSAGAKAYRDLAREVIAPLMTDVPTEAVPEERPAASDTPAADALTAAVADVDGAVEVSDGAFRVTLDNFEGPFDLLLNLISRRQLDVTEVALSQVTDEFITYLAAMDEWDLGKATEFLVVAATLLDLKAARLLPAAEVEDEEDLALLEARDLLFARLLQYRAYKLAAAYLGELDRAQARRHGRAVELEPRFAALLPEVLIGVSPQRFAAIAAAAMVPKPVPVVATDHVHAPQVSVSEHMAIMRERLRRHGSATFRALVSDCTNTLEVVARFLGLLELYREGAVAFDQAAALAELRIRWTGPADAGESTTETHADEEYQ